MRIVLMREKINVRFFLDIISQTHFSKWYLVRCVLPPLITFVLYLLSGTELDNLYNLKLT